jgi:hypothetical protein
MRQPKQKIIFTQYLGIGALGFYVHKFQCCQKVCTCIQMSKLRYKMHVTSNISKFLNAVDRYYLTKEGTWYIPCCWKQFYETTSVQTEVQYVKYFLYRNSWMYSIDAYGIYQKRVHEYVCTYKAVENNIFWETQTKIQ